MKKFPSLISVALVCSCSAGDDGGAGTRVTRPGPNEAPSVAEGGGATAPSAPAGFQGGQLLPDDQAPPSDTNCGLQFFDVERRPADVLLVLDRSGSMEEVPEGGAANVTKWDLTVPALTQVVREIDSGVSWGMKLFPEGQDTGECTAATINDLIHVPPRVEVSVYCLGEVRQPGAIVFKSTDRITLLAVLARAGGLTDRASKKVRIKRRAGEGLGAETVVDYRRVLAGEQPDPELEAGDVVVVKEAFF